MFKCSYVYWMRCVQDGSLLTQLSYNLLQLTDGVSHSRSRRHTVSWLQFRLCKKFSQSMSMSGCICSLPLSSWRGPLFLSWGCCSEGPGVASALWLTGGPAEARRCNSISGNTDMSTHDCWKLGDCSPCVSDSYIDVKYRTKTHTSGFYIKNLL